MTKGSSFRIQYDHFDVFGKAKRGRKSTVVGGRVIDLDNSCSYQLIQISSIKVNLSSSVLKLVQMEINTTLSYN